jgi:DNA polymerase-3 subunit delta
VLTVERSFKWGELLAANQAMSLFGDKKLIELRIPGGKPGKDGSAALQNYAKDLNPDNLTLITLPKLDWQTAEGGLGRQPAAGRGVYRDPEWNGRIAGLDRQRLAARAERGPAEPGLHRRPRGRQFAGGAPGDPEAGLLHEPGKLSFEQVHDAVLNVARYDVFKLSEAMLAGDPARLVRMLEG